MSATHSPDNVKIYVSAPPVLDQQTWVRCVRSLRVPRGTTFHFAFRHAVQGNWEQIQGAIRDADIVIADFTPTEESGIYPDPNILTEAAIARLGQHPKPLIVLHRQSTLALPFGWRQLIKLGGIRPVSVADGLEAALTELSGWLADLISKPLPPPPPPRRTNQGTLDVYITQPMQRGDGSPGPSGFDFAQFFHAARAAAQQVQLGRKVRLAIVKRDDDTVDVWQRILGTIARSSLVLAEFTPDAKSGVMVTPDVVTEASLAYYRYGIPVLATLQEGAALPQNWGSMDPLLYRRDNMAGLTAQLIDQLTRMEQQLLDGPQTQRLRLATTTAPFDMPVGSANDARSGTTRHSLLPPGRQRAGTQRLAKPVTDRRTVPATAAVQTPPTAPTVAGGQSGLTAGAAAGPFQRFQLALGQRQYAEALAAYREAVAIDPWQHALFNPERFVVRDVLGAGAFGVVFRVTKRATADEPSDAEMVLKVLLHPDRLGVDPDALFSNLDLLRHAPRQGLLPIVDWDRYPRGEAQAYWHVWSPYYEGVESLDRVLAAGPLGELETAQVAAGIVTGLMSAHLYRVPHLALRPQNVLVRRRTSKSGKPKLDVYVRDFGFFPDFQAVIFNEPPWGAELLAYAAPEQRGEVPSTPGLLSDIYSLGLVMLTCLFGEPTIDIDTLERLETLHNSGLKAAIEGCLRYDPRTRFNQLEPLLELLKPGTAPVGIRDTMPIPVAAIGSALGSEETGQFDMFGEARPEALEALEAFPEGVMIAEALPAEAVEEEPKPVMIRGATREDGPLRPAAQLQPLDAAPEVLIAEDPLPERPRPVPTYTGTGPRELIVGIDLGTCNSLLAYIDEHGDTKVIHHSQDSIVTPSAVFFPEEFKAEVGLDAKRMALFEPMNVAQFFKLNMGDARRARPIHGTKYSPEMLSALVLRKLVEQAVETLGGPNQVVIRDVVITVPSSWDDVRRDATRLAATLAGLNAVAILSEPVGVALEVALKQLRDGKTVLVYDFGGGTFDVTIFRLVGKTVQLLANMGLPTLGGNNLDQRLYDHVRFLYRDEFEEQDPPDPDNRPQSRWELLSRCEQVKVALCRKAPPQTITVSTAGCTGKYTISLEDFERLIAPDIETTKNFVLGSLLEAGLQPEDIDYVLSVGGSSQIPLVQRMLGEIFGSDRLVGRSVNPQETVARGACRNAADIWAEAVRRGDLPAHAVPQGLLQKLGDAPVLREETPQALAMVALDPEDEAEQIEVVIPQGTPWPARGMLFAQTAEDHQTNVIVRLRSGSSGDVDGTERLGTISFPLVPGVPKGCPIKLEFWYDGPDRLFVAMWDGASGQVQQRKVPWPGPTARQLASSAEIVRETDVLRD